MDLAHMAPYEVRKLIRDKKITGQTSGMCLGYAQANLAILPKELAYDFLLFTQRNPKPCPILEVSDVGDPYLKKIAKDCNIATDIPKYRIYEKGVMTGEYDSVEQFWRDDLVAFLIGCSFSFESELLDSGITVRHIEEHKKRSDVSYKYRLRTSRRIFRQDGCKYASPAPRPDCKSGQHHLLYAARTRHAYSDRSSRADRHK